MVNLVWSIWCDLSAADPTDVAEKVAFNTDTRVAQISRCDPDLIELVGRDLWGTDSLPWTDFLDTWMPNALEQQRARDSAQEEKRRSRHAAQRELRRQERIKTAARREEFAAKRRREAEAAAAAAAAEAAAESAAQAAALVAGLAAAEAERLAQQRQRLSRAVAQVDRVPALYNIAPVSNLRSIYQRGLLSHDRANKLAHSDISNSSVQARRDCKIVAGGRTLHSYANLYFNPKNAMLYSRLCERGDLVVLRISKQVMDTPGSYVTDGNAANRVTRFMSLPDGLNDIDLDEIYSIPHGGWHEQQKRVTQAEVLVPNRIPPQFIESFFAPNQTTLQAATAVVPWSGKVDPELFFDKHS